MKKILYTMIRVADLQRSIDFYSQVLGMKLLSTFDQPKDKFTLAFMGFGEGIDTSTIELTYNYGITQYDLGDGYGHVAIEVDDCFKECENIKELGGNIILEPRVLKDLNEVIAFVADPDGYRIELIQTSYPN
jgi:lactoylglutathione lyase